MRNIFSIRVRTGFRNRFFDCRNISYYRAKRFRGGSFISKGILYEFQYILNISLITIRNHFFPFLGNTFVRYGRGICAGNSEKTSSINSYQSRRTN